MSSEKKKQLPWRVKEHKYPMSVEFIKLVNSLGAHKTSNVEVNYSRIFLFKVYLYLFAFIYMCIGVESCCSTAAYTRLFCAFVCIIS